MSGAAGDGVVITGLGAVSPFGAGVGALITGLRRGAAVLSPYPAGEGAPQGRRGSTIAALAPDRLDPGRIPPNAWRRLDRCSRLAVLAAAEAIENAGLGPAGGPTPAETGVVLGTMTAGADPLREFLECRFQEGSEALSPMLFATTVANAPASQCSIHLGLRGPNLTLSQMEASGLAAIVRACELIAGGAAAAILAGGVDEVPRIFEEAWRRLRLCATGDPVACRGPFDRNRGGFVPGEGAYLLLLESAAHARERGARVLVEVAAHAGLHIPVAPHARPRETTAMAGLLRRMLAGAGVAPRSLGWIAARADATRHHDRHDAQVLQLFLGDASRDVPVSSLKGALGAAGAASAAAVLVAAASIRDGFVPSTPRLVEPDERLGLQLFSGAARERPVERALVEEVATGGACAALVLARPGA